jgi:hypothetical protein
MPATSFSCVWCGAAHTVRSPDDLEGWARLCPDCLGRAGENEFLRFRLRDALRARGAATTLRTAAGPAPGEDWYLRRPPFSFGPIHDAAFAAELDAAGRWLDGLPLAGEIVEPLAGDGWWSPLLAGRGTLYAHDPDGASLDQARARLLAHGLRAHLHERDPWSPVDPPADALVVTFWLGRLAVPARAAWLAIARGGLREGGLLAIIDALPDPASGAAGSVTVEELRADLDAAGFSRIEVSPAGRFIVLARATR